MDHGCFMTLDGMISALWWGLHDASSCGIVEPGGSCQVDCLLPYKGTGYSQRATQQTIGKMVEKTHGTWISTMENLDLRKLIQLIFRCYHLDPSSNLGNLFQEMLKECENVQKSLAHPWRNSQLGKWWVHPFIPWFLVPGIMAWDHLGPGTGTASIATCPLDNINTTGGRRQTGVMVVSWWFHWPHVLLGFMKKAKHIMQPWLVL